MGLAWQQGPLAAASVGHFLTSQPMPEHLLFAEPLRRRMRVRFGDQWIADSEDVLALHEPGRYPVAASPSVPSRREQEPGQRGQVVSPGCRSGRGRLNVVT